MRAIILLISFAIFARAAFCGMNIYLGPDRLVYPYPLSEPVTVSGYLRNIPTGTSVDVEVSLELPDGGLTYLDPSLEFHPERALVLQGFPFTAVPLEALFELDPERIFTGTSGQGTALTELGPGRYVMRASLSGGGVSDSSEVEFFIVPAELLPSIAETPRPVIEALEPPYGAPGDLITIKGRNLKGDPSLVDPALVQDLQVRAVVGGREAELVGIAEDGSNVTVRLGAGTSTGVCYVEILIPYWDENSTITGLEPVPRVVAWRSNLFPFYARPVVYSIEPEEAVPGSQLVITGANFGGDTATNRVFFSGVPGTVTEATNSSLTVIVPELTPGGSYELLVVSNGVEGEPIPIQASGVRLLNWYPRRIVQGDALTIVTNGIPEEASVRVTLGGAPLQVEIEDSSTLTASTGPLVPTGVQDLVLEVGGVEAPSVQVEVLPAW